jgi:hypothetical protein
MDDMLTIVSLYWFTNTITSSVMMYHNTVNFETAMKQLPINKLSETCISP